jgi:hypothetical protein
MNKKDILFFNKKLKYTFHKSTPTTVTSKVLKVETLTHFLLLIVMFKFVMVQQMVALHEQNLTNHSIRAMGATILGRNCSMAQIMAVTGHKSASSVAVYQRVSSKEKQAMGDIITSSVRGEQPSQLSSIMPPHSTSRLQLMPPTQNSSSSTSLNKTTGL